jgi:hypothetical protein
LSRVVGNDCAVEVDTNGYSVPWRLIGERVAVTVAAGCVRVRHGVREVAVHRQSEGRRYETGAMLIPSNRNVAEWGTVFADPVVATAILDRLLHHSHVLTIRGDSYRLRAKRKSGLIKPPSAGDGPPVGSASLRSATGGQEQPTPCSTRGRGQFLMTKRGPFRVAVDSGKPAAGPAFPVPNRSTD